MIAEPSLLGWNRRVVRATRSPGCSISRPAVLRLRSRRATLPLTPRALCENNKYERRPWGVGSLHCERQRVTKSHAQYSAPLFHAGVVYSSAGDGFHYHPLALTNPIDNPFGLSNYFLLPAFFKVSGAISQRASGSWRKD